MKSPGKYVDRSLEDLIQHQQSGWLTGKINSTLPCFILCTGRLGRCWWFLSTTISKLFQQIASDELLIICGMYHGSTHHFQGLLCLRSILNIEPKHMLWSGFGLKEEHFDTEQRYMMFLLQRGTDASYKTGRIFEKIYLLQNITGQELLLSSYNLHVQRSLFFTQLHKRITLNFISRCPCFLQNDNTSSVVCFEGTLNCMAYLAALMRSHFHLLNPAFMLIKVSLVFAEFVAVSHYWEMIIYRPLVCEDHHYRHHFNHWVDYFMCRLVQLHWKVPQDFVFCSSCWICSRAVVLNMGSEPNEGVAR